MAETRTTKQAQDPRAAVTAAVGDRLGNTIKRAEQALIARKTQAMRQFDLTVPQYSVLLLLSLFPGGMSAAQLARESMVTPQTMSTVLANLEKHGLMEREPSPLHQKVIVNKLTRAGRAVLKKADKEAVRVEDGLRAEFTPEEFEQFENYLERAIKKLNETR
ncbi:MULTISPECIES: MarR family winged helix-turn-helix transcriptional regulator [Streptomyces]|uniref:HTH marR-type domain-containing protein n=3 Tax=Streptomyces TaxID=1883 RepID=A0ABQ3BE40_9ACTN|nr:MULTISPECIES: MarR family transcriptional regulator [Streptomyces]MBK3529635.1 MarR family transcriptional regulator [Streptomyces sp. MBT72]MBK3537975.1 MarR family transcriptional regulator [Streptomyces sp. MBT67]MBK3549339.1 MarR family transcriptional regulator [Streptomyces sp. MBT61]MBK6028286.1 MarR family transcriptional regulator [Streptomyces sp. MBT59]MDJ1639446.1 MarR family transcriptional regulator [Streptomyces pakalii]